MTTTTTRSFAFRAFPFAGYVFFNPWVTSYTGSKKLTPEDLGINPKDLPPQDLASLGAMHTCDPKALQPFESARNAMALACLEFGTRRLGGFAVPKDKADACAARLDEIKAEFYAYKATFMAKFVADRDAWIRLPAFAKWTDRIRERLHSVGYIDDRIHCDWEAFTIGSLTDLGGDDSNPSPLSQGALRAANSIGDGALDEIATLAKALIRDSFHDKSGSMKTEVTQKILRPIRRMQEKILANSFADPRLKDVGNYIANVLALLPKEGKMDGKQLDDLYGLALRMADPESILAVASISSTSVELDAAAQQELVEISEANATHQVAQPEADISQLTDEVDSASTAVMSVAQAVQPVARSVQPVAQSVQPAANSAPSLFDEVAPQPTIVIPRAASVLEIGEAVYDEV